MSTRIEETALDLNLRNLTSLFLETNSHFYVHRVVRLLVHLSPWVLAGHESRGEAMTSHASLCKAFHAEEVHLPTLLRALGDSQLARPAASLGLPGRRAAARKMRFQGDGIESAMRAGGERTCLNQL